MKTLLRTSCFETNSSSCHTVAVAAQPATFETVHPNENGEIVIQPGEFGWEEDYYYDSYSKLSYLLVYIRDWTGSDKQDAFRNTLDKVVFDHTGAKLVFEDEPDPEGWANGYIDHQSVEDSDLHYLFQSEDALKNFVFGTDSYIQTDNDNH